MRRTTAERTGMETIQNYIGGELVAPRGGRYLYNIEEALNRIEDGTYGKCVECEQAIGLPRLRRLPYTRMCIDCKEKEEAGNL